MRGKRDPLGYWILQARCRLSRKSGWIKLFYSHITDFLLMKDTGYSQRYHPRHVYHTLGATPRGANRSNAIPTSIPGQILSQTKTESIRRWSREMAKYQIELKEEE